MKATFTFEQYRRNEAIVKNQGSISVLHKKSAVQSERLFAVAFSVLLIIATCAIMPSQSIMLGVTPSFFQTYALTLGGIDIMTAALLLWRAAADRDGRIALLGSAYVFSAPFIFVNTLTLPGVVFPAGHFAPQSSPILWIAWHLGYAVTTLAFAQSSGKCRVSPTLIAAAALGCALLCIAFALQTTIVPAILMSHGSFTELQRRLCDFTLVLYTLALAALLRRGRTITALEVWVCVALVALIIDTLTFNVILNLRRYTVAFYFSRALSVASAGVVLAAIFADLVRMIRRAETLDGYAAVTERLPIIAFIVDAARLCVFVNPAWARLTGQTLADARGRGYQKAFHPTDLADSLDGPLLEGDRQIRLHDVATGDYRRHLLRTVALGPNPAGNHEEFMLIAIDIEAGARAESARLESDLRLQTFIDVVPEMMWITDAAGAVTWYNPAWYAYTGLSDTETLGWGWQTVYHADTLTAVMERWPQALNSGNSFTMEVRLRRYDGVFQWFLNSAVPLRDENGVITRWFGSSTNIDAQKRESERSNRIARVLQEAFLPEFLPTVVGASIDAVYRPAEAEGLVGGDWYDAIALPDGRVLISCGDVVGHGLGAATLAGRYRQSIAVTGVENPNPGNMLTRVNRIAMLQDEGLATAIIGVFDPQTLVFEYALAGHPGPIVAAPGTAPHVLAGGGLPLGVSADETWQTHSIMLRANTVVVLYTDGVTEFARDAVAAEKLLCRAVLELVDEPNVARPAATIMERVLGGAVPADDIAVLVLRCMNVDDALIAVPDAPLAKWWRFHSSDAFTAHTTRLTLSAFLAQHAKDDCPTFEAELIIGEVIANTVEHAPGLVEIHIDWTGAQPVFTARDSGPGFHAAAAPELAESMNENGRGLFLIHALASNIIVNRAPGFGTEIRCTLPVHRHISTVSGLVTTASSP